jgi:hypothetical protein
VYTEHSSKQKPHTHVLGAGPFTNEEDDGYAGALFYFDE